jgi:hypothetical protein
MDAVTLKPRVHEDLDARSISPYPTIAFRHPAYADPDDILFKLPRLDQTGCGPATLAGVHYHTALRACQIVANNAFHGYLATDRDGQDAVAVPQDGILSEDDYWFIVERRDGDDEVEQRQGRDVYPVVPSFEDWQFPHHDFLGLGWDADDDAAASPLPNFPAPHDTTAPPPPSTLRTAVFAVPSLPRSKRCVLSNHSYSINKAHLVPSASEKWFRINSMKRYEDEQHPTMRFIHNTRNTLTIRADLHTMWDAHIFAFVPKRGQFVAHILTAPTQGSREFAAEWHNQPAQRYAFKGIANQYAFAKFAQAVFMLLKPFIAFTPTGKYVARLQAKADQMEYEVRKEWLSGADLQDLYSGGGSRKASESPSSRKRSRSQTSANDGDDEWEWPPQKTARVSLWEDESGEECNCDGEDPVASDDEERGRPRERRQQYGHGRSDHTVDTLPSLTDTSAVDEESLHESSSGCDPPGVLKPPDPLCGDSLISESRG